MMTRGTSPTDTILGSEKTGWPGTLQTEKVGGASFEKAQLRVLFDEIPQPMWFFAENDNFVNAAWRSYVGDKEFEGREWTQWLHSEDQIQACLTWACVKRNNEEAFEGMWRLQHVSGEARWCRVRGRFSPSFGATQSAFWCISFHDAHEERSQLSLVEAELAKQSSMLDVSVDCIKLLDPKGRLIHMNRAGCIALGVPVDEQRFGQVWLELLPPTIQVRGKRALQMARHGKSARFAGMSQMPGEKPMYWDNLLTPLCDENGKTRAILCVSRNVTAQRTAELRLRRASENDELTGLLNRRSFNRMLRKTLRKVSDENGKAGLLLFDLDHFKNINDTLGHQAGDALLRTFARRLKSELPRDAVITRLGGDEFAIVIGKLKNEAELAQLACLVMAQLEAPVSYQGRLIQGGVTIGGAIFPRDAQDPSSLLKAADTALNHRKQQERGGFMLVNSEMREAVSLSVSQLENARLVITEQRLELMFAPIYKLADRTVRGFEARLHWRDSQGQLHGAETLTEAYRDYQLARALGEQLQTRICERLAEAGADESIFKPCIFQVQDAEFMGDDYAEGLLGRLQMYGLKGAQIGVLVSEQALGGRGMAYVARALQALQNHGVHVILDGFGSGPTSLTALHEYPVTSLKVDAKLMKRAVTDESARVILKSFIQICQALSRGVVVGGVTCSAERAMLVWMGCGYAQGPYLGELKTGEELVPLLKERFF